jgi:hypothetical protein
VRVLSLVVGCDVAVVIIVIVDIVVVVVVVVVGGIVFVAVLWYRNC